MQSNEAPKPHEVVVLYSPNDRNRTGLILSLATMACNVFQYRELIFRLFFRDLVAGYRKSFLGATWVLLSPVITIFTWVFMNATGILRPGDTGVPYPVYLLIGTSLWTLFFGFYTSAAATLTAGQSFIFQIKYPHEALLVKQALEQFANFIIGFMINLLVLFAFHVWPSWQTIFLPLAVLPLFFVGAGLGLLTGVIGVVAMEFRKAMDILLGMALFVTPVIFSAKSGNVMLERAIRWNPLSYLIGGPRDLILYGHTGNPHGYWMAAFGSLFFFLVSLRLFYVSEHSVIEKML